MGHFKSRCPNEIKPEEDDDGDFGKGNGGALETGAGGGDGSWGVTPQGDANSMW